MSTKQQQKTIQHSEMFNEFVDFSNEEKIDQFFGAMPVSHSYSIKDIKEMGLSMADNVTFPDNTPVREIAESILNAPYEIGNLWTIAECEHTDNIGSKWGVERTHTEPYLIARIYQQYGNKIGFRLFTVPYHSREHRFDLSGVKYRQQSERKNATVLDNLNRLLSEWVKDCPELTIFTLLNAYDSYTHNPNTLRTDKNVTRFSMKCKKWVFTLAQQIGA